MNHMNSTAQRCQYESHNELLRNHTILLHEFVHIYCIAVCDVVNLILSFD